MAASVVASTTRRKDKIGQVSTTTSSTTRQKDKIGQVSALHLDPCQCPVLALEYLYIICITYVHVAIALVEVITIGFKICCKSFKNGVWRSWAWTCDNNVPSHSIFQYMHALLVLSTQIRSAPRPKPVAIGPSPLLRPSRHVPSCVPWIVHTSQLLVASY